MNSTEINLAIAEACGWKHQDGEMRGQNCIPDYCHDLNAMHEAEKCLPDVNAHRDYVWYRLIEVVGNRRMACCATALQRAEAFLRVKGLWKENLVPKTEVSSGSKPIL